jgi:hypothetical protein
MEAARVSTDTVMTQLPLIRAGAEGIIDAMRVSVPPQ